MGYATLQKSGLIQVFIGLSRREFMKKAGGVLWLFLI